MSIPVQVPDQFRDEQHCQEWFKDMDNTLKVQLCKEFVELDKGILKLQQDFKEAIQKLKLRLKEEMNISKRELASLSDKERKTRDTTIQRLNEQIAMLQKQIDAFSIVPVVLEKSRKRLRSGPSFDEMVAEVNDGDSGVAIVSLPIVSLPMDKTIAWNQIAMQKNNEMITKLSRLQTDRALLIQELDKVSEEDKKLWFGDVKFKNLSTNNPQDIFYMALAALEPDFQKFQKWLEQSGENVPPLTDHGVDVLYGLLQVIDLLRKRLYDKKGIEGGIAEPYYLKVIKKHLENVSRVFPSFFMPLTPSEWIGYVYDNNNPPTVKRRLLSILADNLEQYLKKFQHYNDIKVKGYITPLKSETEITALEDGFGRLIELDDDDDEYKVVYHEISDYGVDGKLLDSKLIKVETPYTPWDINGVLLDEKGNKFTNESSNEPIRINLSDWEGGPDDDDDNNTMMVN